MKRSLITFLVIMILAGSSPGVVLSRAASPCSNSITVTNTGDGGAGSLRQAIADVCAGGTILFDLSVSGQTITLASTLLIDKNLIVDGSMLASKISIDGNQNVTVFEVRAPAVTTLDSLIITNGNTADPEFGGGLYNTGSLHITKSILTHNAGIEGGAIRNMGTLDITESILSDNSADDLGGGILNYGYLNIAGTVFMRNRAGTGGAIYHAVGNIDVEDSLFSENEATGSGTGGGISATSGALRVSNSTFSGNSAGAGGGVYFRQNGLLNIRNSTFRNNSAGEGGGVSTYSNMAMVLNSTFSGNSADNGGGIYNGKFLNVINSTFFGNSAVSRGGGIHNSPGMTLYVTSSTFSNNAAALGGGLSNFGYLQYANTILANSTAGEDCYSPSLAGARIDLNVHNLVEANAAPPNQCGIPLIAADPRLGPLSDHGGPTETTALLPGSPGLGTGDPETCAAELLDNLDQRGAVRPQGDPVCDMGAYESSRLTDLTPPDPPLVTAPASSTNDATPEIRGVAEAGSIVNVWYPGGADKSLHLCQDVPVDESEEWACTSSITLTEGNIELLVHATDEAGNQSDDTFHRFDLDLVAPAVVSILRAGDNPTVSGAVDFTVKFSEPVTGVSASEFSLDTSQPIPGATVADVSGSGDLYVVTVHTGSGNGTLRLDLPSGAAITDAAGNLLGNLPFTTGEAYSIRKPASVDASIHGDVKGSYVISPGTGTRQSYQNTNNGPVRIASTNSIALMAAARVIYQANGINTSYTEMMGIPGGQLDTTYWLPWYNNLDLDTQLRFANVGAGTAAIHVFIGGVEMPGSPITLPAGESTRRSFAGVNAGPVKVVSDVAIVVSERVIYKVSGVPASYAEMMALPDSQLDRTYWLPWYNNRDLDTQLRLANVSDSPASVRIYIGGQEMPGSPFPLLAGESTRKSFPGISAGPVKIISDVNIVAAERIIYRVNGITTSFSEMMALPDRQVDTTYWLPWYNNMSLDTQLRFANVSDTPADVHVYIGGQEMQGSPFAMLAGESARQSFTGINNGPVQILSDVPIVVAQRVIYKINLVATSFSELMGLPDSQLDTVYWFPWYNNRDMDTQLRFAIP